MKIACPHCSQHLELDPETITALEGASHFDCPTCGGAVEVPAPVLVPAKRAAPGQKGKPALGRIARQTQQGMNRNLLVLGVVALLAIGGVALFLASKNGENIFNIFQNTTNEIINNSYFTQLIADGVTTKADLEAIAEIRPYGDGFIGVSKAALDWEQAQEFADRTGARILAVDGAAIDSREAFLTWLGTIFKSHLSSSVWVNDQREASVLASSEILAVREMGVQRKVLLHWWASAADKRSAETVVLVDVLEIPGLASGRSLGVWKKTPLGLEVDPGKGSCTLETPYRPTTSDYDLTIVFSISAGRTGDINLKLPASDSFVSVALQSYPSRSFMGHAVGGYEGKYAGGNDTLELLQLGLATKSTMRFKSGQKYELTIKLRETSLEVVLDNEILISWRGDVSRFRQPPERIRYNPSNLVLGATSGGVVFHRISSSEILSPKKELHTKE